MARQPRLYYPGALYPVMFRGNGEPFFSVPRLSTILLFHEGSQRIDYRIHAFC